GRSHIKLPFGRSGKKRPPKPEYGAVKGIIRGSIFAYFGKWGEIRGLNFIKSNRTVLQAYFQGGAKKSLALVKGVPVQQDTFVPESVFQKKFSRSVLLHQIVTPKILSRTSTSTPGSPPTQQMMSVARLYQISGRPTHCITWRKFKINNRMRPRTALTTSTAIFFIR